MAKTSGLNTTGILSRVTVAAITAALVATTTAAVAADAPKSAEKAAAAAVKPAQAPKAGIASTTAEADYRWLGAVSGNTLYWYSPNGTGGYEARQWQTDTWSAVKNAQQADNDGDGVADDLWVWTTDGTLGYADGDTADDGITVGGGWNIYNKVLVPGNLGGAAAPDMLGRDTSGRLYIYLGYGNGKLTGRTLVGSGWGQYNQITGVGDLSGDGKADIVARDGSGTLWLYKGTGNYKAPFAARTKVGTGWNMFNNLTAVSDLDFDGIADMIARDTNGKLYRYSGTGNAAAPFKPRVLIGNGGWNTYRFMF
ncbi:FG-GAP repeat domain-containing protein [Streptomyces sp. NPDC057271]|uniref:FG-GAP repeat domain-containing protein n=1 Tax=unclassified Streptomyces TaxID=2593676 RepID=UPI003635FD9F